MVHCRVFVTLKKPPKILGDNPIATLPSFNEIKHLKILTCNSHKRIVLDDPKKLHFFLKDKTCSVLFYGKVARVMCLWFDNRTQ